ncbi:MAG: hypothetical protein ACLTDS_15115 [Bianqueaceae bacterium]
MAGLLGGDGQAGKKAKGCRISLAMAVCRRTLKEAPGGNRYVRFRFEGI